jgi:CheY-like chemotaxis protein
MSKHILLIDDEQDIREVTAASLETVAGWQVTLASGGDEGLKLAKRLLPDAILLDVMMPDQDGPATLRRLRKDRVTAKIPVIFLTAKIQTTDQDPRGIGAVGSLSKPFDPLTLAQQVSELLGW